MSVGMDVLAIAEENLLVTLGVALSIGALQGAVLGRGIRKRFPAIKAHARAASLILLALLVLAMAANILQLASPEKTSLSEIILPDTLEGAASLLLGVLGIAGLGSAVVVFCSVTLILLFRSAQIPGIARYFIFGIGVITMSVFLLARFTDYDPTDFQITLYAAYQSGVTAGVFAVTRRRERILSELE